MGYVNIDTCWPTFDTKASWFFTEKGGNLDFSYNYIISVGKPWDIKIGYTPPFEVFGQPLIWHPI